MKRIAAICKETLKRYGENDMNVYAGYATLFLITAIFPFLMLVISIINMLPGYSPSDLTDFLFGFLPDMPSIKSLVLTMISNLKSQSSGLLASVSALTTLWSASAGVSALQKGLKKLTPDMHTKLPAKAVALLFTLAFIVLIPAVILSQVLGDSIVAAAETVTGFLRLEGIADAVASVIRISGVVTIAAAAVVILLTYAYLPGGTRGLKKQLPGTVFTAVVWLAFTKLFSVFIPMFYHSSGVYGSLASLFLMLMWLRFIVTILFYGAALNSALEKEKTPVTEAGLDRAGKA